MTKATRVARVCFWFLWAVSAGGAAGLRWEATTVQRETKLGEETVPLRFAFSNPESRPITVLHVNASCGCTTATLEKKTYAPGEKGQIDVVFDARNLSGVQEKTIQVFTDDSPKPTVLTVRVTIPTWAEISPRLLWWSVGEEGKPKEAVIRLHPGAKLRGESIRVDGAAMTASLTAEEDGRRYRLVVQPASTKAPVQATLHFEVEIDGAAPRKFFAFAQVR